MNTNPKTKGDVLNQTIWNNQFIRVSKSSVFFVPGWKKTSHVFDNETNTLLTFTTFMQKYNFKVNFLQYYRQSSICNTTERENYVKARMFSTVNPIRATCNWKAHLQNNLQCLIQTPAHLSSNCREKIHWQWLYLSRKTKNLLTSFSCYKWSKIIRVSI